MIVLLLIALCSILASARADCDACFDGWCHTRKTLIEGFHITDQLAIDHTHNVLYVQLNSNLNSAFYLDNLKVKMVHQQNTSGMTVDQVTQDLYVADYNRSIYKFKYGSEIPELYSVNTFETDVDLLFFKGDLYYTSRHTSINKGLSLIYADGKYKFMRMLHNLNMIITDFIVDKNNKVYYVANDKVYVFLRARFFNENTNKIVTNKRYVLSTDKHGDVYLGDDITRSIYKLNNDQLIEYGAYKNGSVDRFVFDRDNNIVYHDAVDGNVYKWKKELSQCKTYVAPHTHFSIEELPSVTELNKGAQ